MKDIILSGIQACGKGTQSRLLVEHFWDRMKYFEAGGILRSLQLTDNSIGNYLKNLMPKGLLVDDGVISGLWWVFLSTLDEGDIVLGDGVFRKIGQTIQIVEKMWDKERLFSVVNIDIPEEEVYKRLTSRIVCKSCSKTFSILQEGDISECPACKGELIRRNDDEDKKAISARIEAFHRDTVPCLEWLEKQGLLVRLDGMKSEQELFQEILGVMGKK